MTVLDLIFPKKCINCKKFGEFICDNCFSKIKFNEIFICPHCFRPSIDGMTHKYCKKPYGLDGCMSAVVYKTVVKRLLYQFKYKPNLHRLDKIIGDLMCEAFAQHEGFYEFVERYQPVLMPVPLSSKRLRERGYNHAQLIASYVAQYFKLKTDSKLLLRVRDTKPQYKLNKEERIKNIENAFAINSKRQNPTAKPMPSAVILVDDLATTFSTLKEAARVLKKAGVKKVLGVTFAREI